MRESVGAAATPAARCKNVRRGSFMMLPPWSALSLRTCHPTGAQWEETMRVPLRLPTLLVPAKIPVIARSPIAALRTPATLRAGLRAPATLVIPIALVRIARLPAAAALREETEAVVNPLLARNDRLGRRRACDEAA